MRKENFECALNRVPKNAAQQIITWIGEQAKKATSRIRWKVSIWKMAINANATSDADKWIENAVCTLHVECKGSHRNHHLRFAAHNCKLSCPDSTLFSAVFFFLLWFIHSSQFTHYYLRSLSSTIITVIWCLFGFPPVVLLLHYKNATRIRWDRHREGRRGKMWSDRTPFGQKARKWMHISTLKCHFICILWICGRTIVQSGDGVSEFWSECVLIASTSKYAKYEQKLHGKMQMANRETKNKCKT